MAVLYRETTWHYISCDTIDITVTFRTAGNETRPDYLADAQAVKKLPHMTDILCYLGGKGWQLTTSYVYEGETWRTEVLYLQRLKPYLADN
jgi:hypothetical protein